MSDEKNPKDVAVSIRLSKETKAGLEKIAAQNYRPTSQEARMVLEDYVAKNLKKGRK